MEHHYRRRRLRRSLLPRAPQSASRSLKTFFRALPFFLTPFVFAVVGTFFRLCLRFNGAFFLPCDTILLGCVCVFFFIPSSFLWLLRSRFTTGTNSFHGFHKRLSCNFTVSVLGVLSCRYRWEIVEIEENVLYVYCNICTLLIFRYFRLKFCMVGFWYVLFLPFPA